MGPTNPAGRSSTGLDLDLDLDRIALAASTIDPVFRDSPQFVDERLCGALGREVLVKVETLNPLHSFKGRGAEFFAGGLPPGRRVVCASSGNFGQAIAYACRGRGVPLEVFVPADVNPVKAERMRSLGAAVTVTGGDGAAAGEAARARAVGSADAVFVADGREPAIAEGAGTIGVELLRSGSFDVVVLPVGDGALINGVARWIKEHAPGTGSSGCAPRAHRARRGVGALAGRSLRRGRARSLRAWRSGARSRARWSGCGSGGWHGAGVRRGAAGGGGPAPVAAPA